MVKQQQLSCLPDFIMHSVGPALYNVLNWSISAQSLKKERKKKGAFGTSVPRCLYLVKREAFTTPGPADYQVYWTSYLNRELKQSTLTVKWLIQLGGKTTLFSQVVKGSVYKCSPSQLHMNTTTNNKSFSWRISL